MAGLRWAGLDLDQFISVACTMHASLTNQGQHALGEALHGGERLVQRRAHDVHHQVPDAERLERGDIARHVFGIAQSPPLPTPYASRACRAEM